MNALDPSFGALVTLGNMLRSFCEDGGAGHPRQWSEEHRQLDALLDRVYLENAWFTRESCLYAFSYWGEMLRKESLEDWLAPYPGPKETPLTVALVLAGNIPLVGFHDVLCVLLTGNRALVKCASNDRLLLPFFCEFLFGFEPGLRGRVNFTDGKLHGFDAVVATGSNNTGRYFEYYFSRKPHIIRKNRNGAAVLTGRETEEELSGLAGDVFRYFGLGCRSVSKLFVPQGYDFTPLFQAFYPYKYLLEHPKYANNYDYNKAVYLMQGGEMRDNGFLLLKEDPSMASPIGTLFYETYASNPALKARLATLGPQLQCVVSSTGADHNTAFGKSQWPELREYADGMDTVEFLLKTSPLQTGEAP
ncbi:acyl-CoA reductase [Robiginitalea marina]|uniref:Acyl-CoA reductase n=1 Tax=Robiginitalea marina TaxID=2954105 RepID=A0ABT1AUA1_9FLAO|nr:acyl-CoA reductase [Robiginitalea marina]MCO5723603.1 acyl-CoA reductase [Robiginitalea marina]